MEATRTRRLLVITAGVGALLAAPANASAQLSRPHLKSLEWSNLDITPSVEHPVANTLDLIGEMTMGRNKRTDDLDTTEVTVRGGVRFLLFSRQRRLLLNETLPKRRLVIRDLV